MSIKRLTIDERATYLIGLAVRRQMIEAPRDPATLREVDTVCRWIEHWLSQDEAWEVTLATGHMFDPDAEAVLEAEATLPPPLEGDDDLPF